MRSVKYSAVFVKHESVEHVSIPFIAKLRSVVQAKRAVRQLKGSSVLSRDQLNNRRASQDAKYPFCSTINKYKED